MSDEPAGTQYGGLGIRLLALAADLGLLFLVAAALLLGAGRVLAPDDLPPIALALLAIAPLYWPLMQASALEATLGKAIIGLKVTRFDGRRITVLRSLWRELAKVFSVATVLLGYLMAALMPRKQALHDLLAATYVVRDGPARVVAALAVAAAGFALPLVVSPMVADPKALAALRSTAEQVKARAEGLITRYRPDKLTLPRP
jgi:uncharacterized RDD family membrane protein YckC